MEKPTIYLALTDDWELRGDGSGDMNLIQFHPMRELIKIYNEYGVHSTFMAEVMQQLTFRREQNRFPELKTLADDWDDNVREAYKQGHDIQLHIHPQWSQADFQDGQWKLKGDWSLLNYSFEEADAMLASAKGYLENLLRAINPDYQCAAFRSGSSVIAPSPFALNLLVKHDIVFDMSIVGGLRVNTRNVQFDYTNCDEDFLPFYPRMEDARKVSGKVEPIICVPVFHFYGSRRRVVLQILSKVWKRVTQKNNKDNYANREWTEIGRTSALSSIYDKAIGPTIKGKHLTADTGQLNLAFLREMLHAIRKRARSSNLKQVPVILTNHSKYIKDFMATERFINEVSKADDIKFITLTQLAAMLQAGEFEIRKSDALF